jgi:hypothetical protein
MANGGEREPRVIVGRGPRAVEQQLIETLRPLLDGAQRNPELLARPVLLVVASGTLRRHLAHVLCRELRPTLLGLRIQTLWAVAREILERAGERAPADGGFFEILVRREAAKHEALVERLGALEDGYAAVAASVRDLDSAGLEAARLEAARDAIPDGSQRTPEAQRTAAVLRAAIGTGAAMRALGLGRPADALRRAAALLAERGPAALPARALLVHGFADATGAATTLLRALLALPAATLLLDEPPDPARDDGAPDPGNAFRERFERRLGLTGALREQTAAAGVPTLQFFHAAGREAEAREIAHRVRELLHPPAGSPPDPEQIGVVVRSLSGWELPFRRWFERLGVPFSGGDEPSGLRPQARRLQALLTVLELGGLAPADAWLDTWSRAPHDLRLAFRALGVARLDDAARVDLDGVLDRAGFFPLPVRISATARQAGDETREEEDGAPSEEEPEADAADLATRARRVAGPVLRAALDRVERLTAQLAGWPERARLEQYLDRARALGGSLLAGDAAAAASWTSACEGLHANGAVAEPLARAEFLRLLRPAVEIALRRPLGGSGGGVQLLDVARARSLTFSHLFLAGVNRGLFPRLFKEDPLLPDATRRKLSAVLPDLPEMSFGTDEERFLFAQLVAASPSVTISWQRADEDGKVQDVSPFVRRLELERSTFAAEAIPRLRSEALADTCRRGRPLTVSEQMLQAGLAGRTDLFERLAPLAWRDAERSQSAAANALPGLDLDVLARARRQALEEWDAPPRSRGASPYFGWLAPGAGGTAFAGNEPWVTTVERLARCPWKAFLERSLGLAPPPDPRAAVPEPDPLVLGSVVHGTLHRLAVEQRADLPTTLDALVALEPMAWQRPPAEHVATVAYGVAREVAREAGITLPGLVEGLVRRALPFVDRALELDWAGERAEALGSEVEGTATMGQAGAGPLVLRFRADRVDRRAEDGALVLTDYKTGSPPVTSVDPDARRRNLEQLVSRGVLLQAAAYAAADVAGRKVGRYLTLKGLRDERRAEAIVDSDDAPACEELPHTVATLLEAARAGAFFPRLAEHDRDNNPACRNCDVRTACVLDDSGMKLRWREAVRAAAARRAAGDGLDRRESALVAVLQLGAKDAP